jgi:hypothetical protein
VLFGATFARFGRKWHLYKDAFPLRSVVQLDYMARRLGKGEDTLVSPLGEPRVPPSPVHLSPPLSTPASLPSSTPLHETPSSRAGAPSPAPGAVAAPAAGVAARGSLPALPSSRTPTPGAPTPAPAASVPVFAPSPSPAAAAAAEAPPAATGPMWTPNAKPGGGARARGGPRWAIDTSVAAAGAAGGTSGGSRLPLPSPVAAGAANRANVLRAVDTGLGPAWQPPRGLGGSPPAVAALAPTATPAASASAGAGVGDAQWTPGHRPVPRSPVVRVHSKPLLAGADPLDGAWAMSGEFHEGGAGGDIDDDQFWNVLESAGFGQEDALGGLNMEAAVGGGDAAVTDGDLGLWSSTHHVRALGAPPPLPPPWASALDPDARYGANFVTPVRSDASGGGTSGGSGASTSGGSGASACCGGSNRHSVSLQEPPPPEAASGSAVVPPLLIPPHPHAARGQANNPSSRPTSSSEDVTTYSLASSDCSERDAMVTPSALLSSELHEPWVRDALLDRLGLPRSGALPIGWTLGEFYFPTEQTGRLGLRVARDALGVVVTDVVGRPFSREGARVYPGAVLLALNGKLVPTVLEAAVALIRQEAAAVQICRVVLALHALC